MNNTTNNSTFYNPIDTGIMPDFGQLMSDMGTGVQNILVSWGFDPFSFVFTAFLGLAVIVFFYYVFVSAQSRSSWIFKPIFYGLAVFFILILLELI